MNALNEQVGGKHYKTYAIQPVEYAMANNLNHCQGQAVKYITRYKDKGGPEDIRKAIHFLEMLLEIEYGTEKEPVRPKFGASSLSQQGELDFLPTRSGTDRY